MKRGYTLLEILVVLAIIVILVLIAFPNMVGFVKTSKEESAVANAAAIYTIADNYMYEDIFLSKNDTYKCKNGCTIPSNTIDPNHRKLVDLIDAEMPDREGTYTLMFQPGGNLQVEYKFSDDTKGIYPDSIAVVNTTLHSDVTKLTVTGTYPRITDITTTITTSKSSSDSSVTSDSGIFIYDTGIPTNSTWPAAIKPWPTRLKGDTFKVNGRYWLATQQIITINDSHSTPSTHPNVIEINNKIIKQSSSNPITYVDQYGSRVTSINIGDILQLNGSYYVCIKNNAKIKYPLNTSHWIKLE